WNTPPHDHINQRRCRLDDVVARTMLSPNKAAVTAISRRPDPDAGRGRRRQRPSTTKHDLTIIEASVATGAGAFSGPASRAETTVRDEVQRRTRRPPRPYRTPLSSPSGGPAR